ncbi:amino acid ABC transporter membrane protein 2 (PAAT family) [Hasllibacter halocynthiae]|uniref:Amino acid ABC transporter membrane protein 2 (PAAT family) n=1 Tax=Hasllibacter halocynthiae TaxID=595589 RepID=A0A2T0X6U8_9RHOB|nr:amino acid ABC transporter permease [Hasllibacter halocynthiae]PRY94681.1 amino acid ABC transporter membrane protein 2 (PAAT family) [Hasllibacter halocynthiae]
MSCWDTVRAYAFRSVHDFSDWWLIPASERLLPRSDFTLCQQVTLIGSGMIWNVYFGVLALAFGFFLAVGLAMARFSENALLRKPADWFVFLFRGSPLFIQFFLAYEALVLLPRAGFEILGVTVETGWLTRAWAGALIVLFFNTSAYAAEIFLGALRSIPKGDLEAAEAYGLTGWTKFRRITFPTMLRLAWPGYTNEAIFLFHATTLVFFSGFPAWRQMGDALYYANYFADKTFNPFVPYPIVALYFVALTLLVIAGFGAVNRRLNRHLPDAAGRVRARPQIVR